MENSRRGYLVALCLAIQSLLLIDGARGLSPTVDEPGHLAAGCSYWLTGNFDLYRVNPPLVKAVGAAGALLCVDVSEVGLEVLEQYVATERWPRERKNLECGHEFLLANPAMAERGLFVARIACLPFCWIGGLICFRWATQLYGQRAGWIALLLWCFEPMILGHGCLLTMDVPGAAMGLLAMYGLWCWMQRQTWSRTGVVGLTSGLALLTKFTWVILPLLCMVIWGIALFDADNRRQLGRQVLQVLVAAAVCLLVINLGYAFDRSGIPLGSYLFISDVLSVGTRSGGNPTWGSRWGFVPIPLPAAWLSGLDVQKYDFEFKWRCYLDGAWKEGGWWYFYVLGLAYKLPVGTLVLVTAATIGPIARKHPMNWRNELIPLVTAIAVVALASLQTKFTLHVRYVIPALPFLFIWAARVLRDGSPEDSHDLKHSRLIPNAMSDPAPIGSFRSRLASGLSWQMVVVGACLIWNGGSALSSHPHCLSYFNEFARQPNGSLAEPPRLLDSNLDWGQDLLLLRDWIHRNAKGEPLYLAHFGYIDPRLFGLKFEPVPELTKAKPELPPGIYAVSVNYLFGHRFHSADGQGGFEFISGERVAPLREFTPITYIGSSTWIYRIKSPNSHGDAR